MRVLELFSGTCSISRAFESRGHECVTVELDHKLPATCHLDVMEIGENWLEDQGHFDVVWASPPCTTYSVAGIGHHRVKNHETGECDPVSEYAKVSDELVKHTLHIIEVAAPKYWFIENPVGALRKMRFMDGLPRYTVTYCQYGDIRQKPTDLWTNHPDPQFKPCCHRGDPCHQASPRHSNSGTQGLRNARERGKIPQELCEHIVDICEVL